MFTLDVNLSHKSSDGTLLVPEEIRFFSGCSAGAVSSVYMDTSSRNKRLITSL